MDHAHIFWYSEAGHLISLVFMCPFFSLYLRVDTEVLCKICLRQSNLQIFMVEGQENCYQMLASEKPSYYGPLLEALCSMEKMVYTLHLQKDIGETGHWLFFVMSFISHFCIYAQIRQ